MPYLTIFNKLKHFTVPTFGVLLKTLTRLFWDSLSTVLDSIVNLCTGFSSKLNKFSQRSQNLKKSHVMLMEVIHHSLYSACHG